MRFDVNQIIIFNERSYSSECNVCLVLYRCLTPSHDDKVVNYEENVRQMQYGKSVNAAGFDQV